jgi:uncharacterized lipoprotein YajG
MKKSIAVSLIVFSVFSFVLAACASSPKETAPKATAEEIDAARAEVTEAEANLATAEAEAREAAEVANADRSSANIAAFMEKKDAWDTANQALTKAKAKLKKLQQ